VPFLVYKTRIRNCGVRHEMGTFLKPPLETIQVTDCKPAAKGGEQ